METVGKNNLPPSHGDNNKNWGVRKCFAVYANLLSLDAPADVRKHAEHVVLNDDKTFSMFMETNFINPDGSVELLRVKDTRRFRTTAMLCYQNYINPQTLISLN